MKRETQEAIRDALAWVVSTPMHISWRSNQPFPGAGERKSRRRGPTIPDFATHKEWEPGDDVNNIDWVASAQTNMQELVLRVYHEPRDINIVIVADSGPSMGFGTTEVTKRQFLARATASILVSAEKTHDLVGLIAYPDEKQKYLINPRPAKSSLREILHNVIECGSDVTYAVDNRSPLEIFIAQVKQIPWISRLLTRFQPASGAQPVPVPQKTSGRRNITGLSDALVRLPKARSLVFVISDFLNLSDADKRALQRAARTHYVVCLGVHDVRESELPDGIGIYTLKDITTGVTQSIWLNDENRRIYRENFQKAQQSLEEFFRSSKVHYSSFSTADSDAARQGLRELFWMYR
jgi:uncharacterized protein (DUF58 family)